jgi:hypothetical protein
MKHIKNFNESTNNYDGYFYIIPYNDIFRVKLTLEKYYKELNISESDIKYTLNRIGNNNFISLYIYNIDNNFKYKLNIKPSHLSKHKREITWGFGRKIKLENRGELKLTDVEIDSAKYNL